MSRFHPAADLTPLFDAVEQWRSQCLINDGSLWSGNNRWTLEHLQALAVALGDKPPKRGGDPLEKLCAPVKNAADELKHLLAELYWVYLLFPSTIADKPGRLRDLAGELGIVLPLDHQLFDEGILQGVGNAFASYQNYAWREVRYLISVVIHLKKEPVARREQRLGEPFIFAADLDTQSDSVRVMRHILCYLLFPDAFEPIVNLQTKRKVLVRFAQAGESDLSVAALAKLKPVVVDEKLLAQRERLATQWGADFDYFQSDIYFHWKSDQANFVVPLDSEARFVDDGTAFEAGKAREVLAKGRKPALDVMLASGGLTKLKKDIATMNPGDRVYLVDPAKGILIARGRMLEELREESGRVWLVVGLDEVLNPKISVGLAVERLRKSGVLSSSKIKSALSLPAEKAMRLDQFWRANADVEVALNVAPEDIADPINQIFQGPPGTGKTRRLEELAAKYRNDVTVDLDLWIKNQIEPFSWRVLIAAVLAEQDRPLKVQQILQHPWIKAKVSLSSGKTPYQTIQATLQYHTTLDSQTVNAERRMEPYLFDKKSDAGANSVTWHLLDDWESKEPSVITLIQHLRKGPPPVQTQPRYHFVSFHQSYSYEEFVEGLRPVEAEQGIIYQPVDGIFKKLCDRAQKDPSQRYALFIDEINRADVSAVFGELISLIECEKRVVWGPDGSKRAGLSVTLPVSRRDFGIPKNLDIYATMNTADRSIAPMDLALRRRFTFIDFYPDSNVLRKRMANQGVLQDGVDGDIDIAALLARLNRRLRVLLDADHTLGHSFFLKVTTFEGLKRVLFDQIIPLLHEMFVGDPSRIRHVLGPGWVEEVQLDPQDFFGETPPLDALPFKIIDEATVDGAKIRALYE